MKKVEAIIKPFKLDDVKEALQGAGIKEILVTETKSFGLDITKEASVTDYVIDFFPKVKVEIVVEDKEAEKIVDILKKSAITDRADSGRILILPLEKLEPIA